jgi:O-acetyl-ADP-ribose deacetylase (regulator of RNase III)
MALTRLKGDLIELALEGQFNYIAHGCNCFHAMKSGIAGQIAQRFAIAAAVDRFTLYGDRSKLGSWSLAPATTYGGSPFFIVNAYTQYTYSRSKDVFEYGAFDTFLDNFGAMLIKELEVSKSGAQTVGFPKIGCGLAGGDEATIVKKLEAFANRVEPCGVKVSLVEWERKS